VSDQYVKESVVEKPADNVTLSAEAGEALIARVQQSNVSADDAGGVERVMRLYCWVVFALQEAKLRAKRLRNVLCGQGRTPKTPPAPKASSTSSDSRGAGEGGGEAGLVDEAAPEREAPGCAGGPAASEGEASPQPTGGQRAGTGHLGADASGGAERTECRHAELAVGQRCPVCGQGPF
jgi:hypothetical protein